MDNITLFKYQSHQVRIIQDAQGDPWWVAKNVCDILGLTNPSEAIKMLDDDERSTLRISEGTSPKGGNPNVNIINESGLYNLIIRSNKPEANKFRRWITHEVHLTKPKRKQTPLIPYFALI